MQDPLRNRRSLRVSCRLQSPEGRASSVKPRRIGTSGRTRERGLKIVNVKTKLTTASFAEPFDDAWFSQDGSRLLIKTADAKIVMLAVPGGEELARQPIPARFELTSMVAPDVAFGTVDQDSLFVRLDDGRRLWVRAALRDGASRVTLHDEEHYAGDADGPVLIHRGGGWLTPDLVPLDQAPDRHRPGLLGEFLSKR